MNYDEILDKFYDFIESEFDLQHLDKLKELYGELQKCFNSLASFDANKNNKDYISVYMREHFRVCEMLKTAMCTKLQGKLGLENEIIVCICNIIVRYFDRIREIHVLDDDIIVWLKDTQVPKIYEPLKEQFYAYKENDKLCYSEPLKGKILVDVTSNEFYCNNDGEDSRYYELANYIINAIIKGVVKPALPGSGVDNSPITITPKKISYSIPGLQIFSSNSLKDISSDEPGTKITKVIVAYQNKVLDYDLKIHDRELSDSAVVFRFNGDSFHVLSERLSGTDKTGGAATRG